MILKRITAAILAVCFLPIYPVCVQGAASAAETVSAADTDCRIIDFSEFEKTVDFINGKRYETDFQAVAPRKLSYGGKALQLQAYTGSSHYIEFSDTAQIKKLYPFVKITFDVEWAELLGDASADKTAAVWIGSTKTHKDIMSIIAKKGTKTLDLKNGGNIRQKHRYYSYSADLSNDNNGDLRLYFGNVVGSYKIGVSIKNIMFFKTRSDAQSFDESVTAASYGGEKCSVDGFNHVITLTLPKNISEDGLSGLRADQLTIDMYNKEADDTKSYENGYKIPQECRWSAEGEPQIVRTDEKIYAEMPISVTNMLGETVSWTFRAESEQGADNGGYYLLNFADRDTVSEMLSDGTVAKTSYVDIIKHLEASDNGLYTEGTANESCGYTQALFRFDGIDTTKPYCMKMLYLCKSISDGKNIHDKNSIIRVAWNNEKDRVKSQLVFSSLPQKPDGWSELIISVPPSTNPADISAKQLRVMTNFACAADIKYIGMFETATDAENFDFTINYAVADGKIIKADNMAHTLNTDGDIANVSYALYSGAAVTEGVAETADGKVLRRITATDISGKTTEWTLSGGKVPRTEITVKDNAVAASAENLPSDAARLTAVYDNRGHMVSVTSADEVHLPDCGAFTAKSFLWNGIGGVQPITAAAKKSFDVSDFGKYDTENVRGSEWEAVPLMSERQAKSGEPGGEGGQYETYMTISADGSLLLSFADVGNIMKSTDGGKTWTPCGRGLGCGLSLGVIDPNNPQKVIGGTFCGTQSTRRIKEQGYTEQGLYFSTDGAENFSQSMIYNDTSALGFRDAIAYDAHSYDAASGESKIVYYSTPSSEFSGIATVISNYEKQKGYNEGPGLYKSTDGGRSWKLVNSAMGAAELAVSPKDGKVFAVRDNTLYVSCDGGNNFAQKAEKIYDVETLTDKSGKVYLIGESGVYKSSDNGENFALINSTSYSAKPSDTGVAKGTSSFHVSTKNPDYMAYFRVIDYAPNKTAYFSKDGGVTWTASQYDEGNDFYTNQPRQGTIVYSPLDENVVYCCSDWPWKSTDGGKIFKSAAGGFVGTAVCSWWKPNIYNPDLWFVPIQDFLGALSFDGGKTFRSLETLNSQRKILAHQYGAYAVDEKTYFACTASQWEQNECDLIITFDGGITWEKKATTHYGVMYNRCLQSPNNKDILFAGSFRSTDGGHTWSEMSNVKAVSAYSMKDKRLFGFGTDGYSVVISRDDGATWTRYKSVAKDSGISYDTIAYCLDFDYDNNILYFARGGSLYKYKDGQLSSLRKNMEKAAEDIFLRSMTVDPIDPNVIYVSGEQSDGKQMKTSQTKYMILRSCDGGETWQVISTVDNDRTVIKSGPVVGRQCAQYMWVHPETGYLYTGSFCGGLWRLEPPYRLNNQ